MITQVRIFNFKSIQQISIDLSQINIFVGSNNSGKTTIMQAVHMMASILQSVSLVYGSNKLSSSGSVTLSSSQILYTPFEDIDYFAHKGILTQTSGFTIGLTFASGETLNLTVRRGKNRNLNISFDNPRLAQTLAKIDDPFSIFVPGLAGISKNESFETLGVIRRTLARGDANLILRNILYKLRQDSVSWQSFINALKSIFGEVDITCKFDEGIDEFIQVIVNKEGSKLPIDAMGTGFLQTAQILSYSYLFKPTLLLLDEPDSHVHPNNQRKLMNVLSSLGIQIIASTHSRHILDAVNENVRRVWIREGEIHSYNSNLDILLDIGAIDAAEGLLSNQGIKYVLLTEDQDTKLVKAIMESHVPESEYVVWSYKGCTNTPTAIALTKLIKDISSTVTVVVHRDRDCISDDYFKA